MSGAAPTPEQAALFCTPPALLYQPQGCTECDGLGVRGRIALHEVLTTNDAMEAMIMERADTPSLREIAVANGMQSLLHDGLDKAAEGLACLQSIGSGGALCA